MGILYVGNVFTFGMVPLSESEGTTIEATRISADTARLLLAQADSVGQRIVSALGHADIAAIASRELSRELPAARLTVQLQREDALLVAQYIGPRLAEGVINLPDGARVDWLLVERVK